jgi:hypothetical protein
VHSLRLWTRILLSDLPSLLALSGRLHHCFCEPIHYFRPEKTNKKTHFSLFIIARVCVWQIVISTVGGMLFCIFVLKPDVYAGWRAALGLKVSAVIPLGYSNSKSQSQSQNRNQNTSTVEKEDEIDKSKSLKSKPSDIEMASSADNLTE